MQELIEVSLGGARVIGSMILVSVVGMVVY
jgi:hypothetical protein